MIVSSRAKSRDPLVDTIRGEMKADTGEGNDYDALLDAIGDASIVCLCSSAAV